MMVRLRCALVALVVVANVASCSSATSTKQVMLTFMHWQETTVAGSAWWDQITQGFEAAHPGVKVQTNFVTFAQYMTTLDTMIAGGTLPDIFFGNPKTIELGRAGKVVDFSKVFAPDYFKRFYSGPLKQTMTADGATYGLPMTAQMFALFVHPTVMTSLGLTPPKTWDDLLAMTPTIRAAGYVPLVWGDEGGFTCGDFALPLITQYGGNVYALDDLTAPGVSWNSQPVIQAFALLQRLEKAGVFVDGINAVTESQARQVAYTGRAAMMFNESSMPGVIPAEASADYANSYYLAKVPALTAGGVHWAGDGTGESIAVNSESPNKDLAIQFVQYLFSDDVYRIYIGGSQNLPSLPSAVSALKYKSLQDMAAWADTDGTDHILFGQGSSEAFINACQGVLDGSLSPEAAAAQIEHDVTAARATP